MKTHKKFLFENEITCVAQVFFVLFPNILEKCKSYNFQLVIKNTTAVQNMKHPGRPAVGRSVPEKPGRPVPISSTNRPSIDHFAETKTVRFGCAFRLF